MIKIRINFNQFSTQKSIYYISNIDINKIKIIFVKFKNILDDLLTRNSLDSDVINLGEFRLTRLYNAFNPNENYRVIKSYQHRKKKLFDNTELS